MQVIELISLGYIVAVKISNGTFNKLIKFI